MIRTTRWDTDTWPMAKDMLSAMAGVAADDLASLWNETLARVGG